MDTIMSAVATDSSTRFEVPTSLSPSRVESFLKCPLAFRFSSIERLPDPPTVHTTRGSLVHRALELLFTRPAAERTADALDRCTDAPSPSTASTPTSRCSASTTPPSNVSSTSAAR